MNGAGKMSKVKLCGMMHLQDIDAANLARPDYVGFVLAKSRRQITKEQAKEFRKRLDPLIVSVGVFVNEEIETVADYIKEEIISVVQLHGQENSDYIKELKGFANVPVIKAISVKEDFISQVKEHEALLRLSYIDFLLFDQGAGGTGQTFDWRMLDQVQSPYFLAGGLNETNLEQALVSTKPYAYDLSSGIETNGIKDAKKMITVVRRIREYEGRNK